MKILRCNQTGILVVLILLAFPLCSSAQEWRWDIAENWSDVVIAPEGTTGGSLLGELKDSAGVNIYTLGVGASYYYKKFNSGWVLYHDLQAAQRYWFHSDSTAYSRTPSYADIDFRRSELANREFIGGVVGNIPEGGNLMGSDYDLACLFGIDSDEAAAFDWVEKKNRVSGKIADEEVFNFLLSKKELSAQYANAFELFLRYEVYLHPEAISQFMGTSKQISSLSFGIVSSMKKLSYDIEFKSTGEDKALYDVTSRFDPKNLQSSSEGAQSLDAMMSTAVNNRLYHDYAEMAIGYIDDSLYCDAMLVTFALTLSEDPQPVELLKEIVGHQADDPRLALLLSSLSIRDTSEARVMEKISSLQQLRADTTLENRHIVDVFLANTFEEKGDLQMAESHFLSVLNEDPYLAAPYHDLGLLYTRLYQFDSAWKCFDIGLTLNENHPIFSDIKQRKTALTAEYPQFFLK